MGNADGETLQRRRLGPSGGGGSSAEWEPSKRRIGTVSPGGARRLEFSDYVQGITSVWILHPVFLAALARYAGEGPNDSPVALLMWNLVACFASLWYWWDRRNAFAKWFDRTTATGCAIGYMTISIAVGGTVLARSSVLLVLVLSCFVSGWLVEDWLWCHVFFRYFIFWLSYLTMAGRALPASPSMVLVTSAAMFGGILLEQALAERQGLQFSLQRSYSQGILRCGVAAVAAGSFAWASAS